jgi:hypothetical protein
VGQVLITVASPALVEIAIEAVFCRRSDHRISSTVVVAILVMVYAQMAVVVRNSGKHYIKVLYNSLIETDGVEKKRTFVCVPVALVGHV